MAYKPFHTFNYYFFDDFRLEKGTTTDITCFLINLGNIESFNKRSVWAENQSEISISNTLVKSDNLSDTFNELFQKKSSLIVKSYDQEFGFRKVTEKHPVMISQVTSSADNNANTSRGAAVIKTKTAINNQFDPTEQTLIYASDSIENGIKRFDLVSGQFRNRIHSLETFYMRDSHPDFLQFNHCYDISPLAMNEYDYVPLSIINSFARETEKVPIFSHHCNYQMIRFRPHNFEGGKKVGGKNFEDDPEYTNEKQSII
jgi:catabolite regulation protein CreA